jgi:erythromycin esterase-like protein
MQCDHAVEALDAVRECAHAHTGALDDYAPLMELIGDAHLVLLGQGSYGTHEFYAARARITRRLIEEKGFSAVAVDADWAGASRVNWFVQGDGENEDALAALDGFCRFPAYLSRNAAVIDFLEWMRAYNQALQGDPAIGFHGLDFYNTHNAYRAAVAHLDRIDPAAAERMRFRYAYTCFGELVEEAGAIDDEAGLRPERLPDELLAEIVESRRRSAAQITSAGGNVAEYESFFRRQDAALDDRAEQYYRTVFGCEDSPWNVRNDYLAENLTDLVGHLERSGVPGKVVLWAHNKNAGDSRAMEMIQRHESSVGSLMRQRHGPDAVLMGFTTDHGMVRAASKWDGCLEQQIIVPSLPDSYESLFHEVGHPRFLLPIRGNEKAAEALRGPRLQRSIGVIYRPGGNALDYYTQARLSDQFDAVVHFDQTTAVHPLFGDPGYGAEAVPRTDSTSA